MRAHAFRSRAAAALLVVVLFGCGDAAKAGQAATGNASATPVFGSAQSISAKPVVVLVQSDPWLMVIGSDSPRFVLYDDGTVIYRTRTAYVSAPLSEQARDAILHSVSDLGLDKGVTTFQTTGSTDQPTNILFFFAPPKPRFVLLYGALDQPSVRTKVPKKVLAAYDALRSFSAQEAKPWLPAEIEVMVWPYDYAPDESIVWPSKWPGLADKTTRKRGESYSIFIPSEELAELRSFLAQRREKGAVEIGGKKWAVSLRLPFPGEEAWMPGSQ